MHKFGLRALVISAAMVAPLSAQAQAHVYQLNNTLADSYAGPALQSMGGVLSASGYHFSGDKGLTLSGVFNSASYALGDYTIVMRAKLTTPGQNGSDGLGKLVDFKNGTSASGYYNLGDGSSANGYGETIQMDNTRRISAFPYSVSRGYMKTTLVHTANLFTVYILGGEKIHTFTDTFNDFTFDQPGGIARFFTDDLLDPNNDHSTTGDVNYIATYNFAMTHLEVENYVYDQTLAPEPASMVLLATGLVGVFGAARRRRQG